MDAWLFHLMNDLVGRMPLLDATARFLVNDYAVPTALSLCLVALWFSDQAKEKRENNQRAVFHALLGLLLANALVRLCNLVYFRPRPFASHAVNLLFYRPSDSSLPSNPAAVGFASATAIWLHNRRVGGSMYLLATLFALARVYCGVHYPLDVVAGGLVGALSALFIVRNGRFFEPLFGLLLKVGRRLCLA